MSASGSRQLTPFSEERLFRLVHPPGAGEPGVRCLSARVFVSLESEKYMYNKHHAVKSVSKLVKVFESNLCHVYL